MASKKKTAAKRAKAGATTAPAVPAKRPVDPIYRRADGVEFPRASLRQYVDRNRWVLVLKDGGGFVNSAADRFEGVEEAA